MAPPAQQKSPAPRGSSYENSANFKNYLYVIFRRPYAIHTPPNLKASPMALLPHPNDGRRRCQASALHCRSIEPAQVPLAGHIALGHPAEFQLPFALPQQPHNTQPTHRLGWHAPYAVEEEQPPIARPTNTPKRLEAPSAPHGSIYQPWPNQSIDVAHPIRIQPAGHDHLFRSPACGCHRDTSSAHRATLHAICRKLKLPDPNGIFS